MVEKFFKELVMGIELLFSAVGMTAALTVLFMSTWGVEFLNAVVISAMIALAFIMISAGDDPATSKRI